MAPSKRRNSRWSRDPVATNGKPKIARLTDRDIEVFKLLARYPCLPLDDLHAFVGGSMKGLAQHLNLLSRKPNLYLNRPAQQRQRADANYRPLIYELDVRGAHALRERGWECLPRKYRGTFAHQLMVCRIMASIELGTLRNENLRLITWPEILAHPKTPHELRKAQRPTYIPLSFTHRGETITTEVSADATPFGIERTNADGSRAYFFFPGIEADTGTEPIGSYDFERSSIYRKFLAYRAIAEQRIYAIQFGFPNFFVPIVSTTTPRMLAMMRCLEKLTGAKGSAMFLFKTFPTFTAAGNSSPPTGQMLTEPWQRVGCSSLDLDGRTT